jgi:hypothetical protein
MSAYFGNGYFLNILQRGAAPVGKTHSSSTQAPIRLEETVATSSHSPAEVSTQAVRNESLDRPQTASTATQPLSDNPLTEFVHVEAPVSPVFDSRENIPLETISSPTRETRDTPNQNFQSSVSVESSEPAAPLQVSASSTIEPFVPTVAEPLVSTENPRAAPTSNRVFELRMPENFFGHTTGETLNAPQIKPAPPARIFSAVPEPQTESQPAAVHFSEPAVPANIPTETQTQSVVVIPERANALSEIQTIELSHPGPTSEAQAAPPVENEVVVHVSAQPSRLVVAEIAEAPNAKARVEPTSKHVQPRQPSIAPAPPPARLHINRVDIQVINHVPPPPPAAHVPDISQLLEKKHLGRVELLL